MPGFLGPVLMVGSMAIAPLVDWLYPKPCKCPDLYVPSGSGDNCKCTPGPALEQAILYPVQQEAAKQVPGTPQSNDFFGVPLWVLGVAGATVGVGIMLYGAGSKK